VLLFACYRMEAIHCPIAPLERIRGGRVYLTVSLAELERGTGGLWELVMTTL
jgi:hypothetical protein